MMPDAKHNKSLGLWFIECKCGLWTVFAPTKVEAEDHYNHHKEHKCRAMK